MKYFLDPAIGVRAFETDGSQDFLITEDMRHMSPEEVHQHLNPPKTEEQILLEQQLEARQYLVDTDWYVIRFTETGVAIPTEVTEQRAYSRSII